MAQHPLLNNRYRIIGEEGAGGMAVVYRAQDLELDRIVAVKVLKPQLTSDPEFIMRFRAEARAAANLSHPNIVTVHDVGQDGRTHYMVLEYVEGDNLKNFIMTRAPLDVESALLITIEICKGLGYAHRAGLVHCDVKPQNILVTDDRRIRVTDFGLARALTTSAPTEKAETVWGSPSYMAPELSAGEAPTPASDVYSLGITMFELLTGKLPFQGKDFREMALAHQQQPAPHVYDYNPMAPIELDTVIQKVLSKEASQRYRMADQLGRVLMKYREKGVEATASFPITASQPAVAQPPAPSRVDTEPGAQAVVDQSAEAVPELPPLDVGSYKQRTQVSVRRPSLARAMRGDGDGDTTAARRIIERQPDGSTTIDLYGVALGLLVLAALLGLIPLWISVWNTFFQ